MMTWPDEVLRNVEKMSEVQHAETIDLIAEGDEEEAKIGTLDLLIRFKPKCKNLE